MRVDTLPRVMAFCIVGFGVPMGTPSFAAWSKPNDSLGR